MSYRSAFSGAEAPNYKVEATPAAAANGLALCYNSGNQNAAFQTPVVGEALPNGTITFSGPGAASWPSAGVSGHTYKLANNETWATVYIGPAGVNAGSCTGQGEFDGFLPAGYSGISDTVVGCARIHDSVGAAYYTCAVNVVGLDVKLSCTAIAGGLSGTCSLSGMVLNYRLS